MLTIVVSAVKILTYMDGGAYTTLLGEGYTTLTTVLS